MIRSQNGGFSRVGCTVRCAVALLITACGISVRAEDPPAAAMADAERDSIQDIFFCTPQKPLLIRLRIYINGTGFRTLRHQWADAQFASLDTDQNGVLEGDELKRIPAAGTLRADGSGAAPQIPPADSDPEDGKVSREECRRYLTAASGTPFSLQSQANQQRLIVFAGQQAVQVNLFPKIDTDLDGKLSKPEIEAAADRLRRYDRNEDDIVDNFELQQSLPEEQFTTQQQLAGVLRQLLIVDSHDVQALSRRLLESYDKASRDPASRSFRKDEKLSRNELQLAEAKFALADRNQDGKLDRKEMGQLSTAMEPDLELEIQSPSADGKFSVKPLRSPDPAIASWLKVASNPNGLWVLSLNDTELALSAAGPERGSETQLRETYLQQFKTMDQDKNDYLDRMELQRFGFPDSFFTLSDADSDGKVFEPEYTILIDRQIGLSKSSMALEVSSDGRSLFQLIDTTPDGRLSLRELADTASKFSVWDTNGDGAITLGELSIQLDAVFRAGTPRVNGPFQNVAAQSAMNEVTASGTPKDSRPAWFVKMDKNRDGDLSPKEFLGRKVLFNQIDANQDGLISPEEAAAANNTATPKP